MEIQGVVVLAVGCVLLLGTGIKGYRQGFAAELQDAVCLLCSIVAVLILTFTAKSYVDGETIRFIAGIVCLAIAILSYRILKFLLGTLEGIAKIPILRSVNKIFGFLLGMAEAVVLLWTIHIVLVAIRIPMVSEYVLTAIDDNEILTIFFGNNLLANYLAGKEIILPFLEKV